MAIWVAAGYGFPGGSVWRRGTGQEGPTGGLTTAMRAMLRGQFAVGSARHAAAPFVFAFLVAQLAWRSLIVGVRAVSARLPASAWVVDLIASMVLFGAAIWVPWLTR
ncbi:MAG: hypothetical protein NT062_05035 [Proteobacteria bacterium]|nr:hypothetical protein [Pseudomonadota bacterium]